MFWTKKALLIYTFNGFNVDNFVENIDRYVYIIFNDRGKTLQLKCVQYRPQVTYHSLASSECSQRSRVTRAYSFDATLASQMNYFKRDILASLAY